MSVTAEPQAAAAAVRPFHVDVPQAELDDLRQRLENTRWPDKETVDDGTQGAQLARMQELVGYWATDYDWRKLEAKLNALPQFVTEIDDLDIHFIHVKSPHEGALPLIVTHGWPGSIVELVSVIEPLTKPTEHGGSAEDAFDVVIPSLPGYGFSSRPTQPGWGPERIAAAWHELMGRLGYDRYVSQGGDWGAAVAEAMGRQAPAGLAGIHVNLPATVPPDVEAALAGIGPVPEMSDEERAVFEALRVWHPGFGEWAFGDDPNDAKTKDAVLDDITLYWLTNTATSAGRLYWENHGASPTSATAMKTADISVPVGVTVFPEDVYAPPRSWAERAYPNLVYYNKVDRGGHFAAWEQPELFSAELRAAFKWLRNGRAS